MIAFLKANGLTILISALLVLFVVLVIRKLIKNKKAGKTSCGCDCSTCGAYCSCNQKPIDKRKGRL